MTVEADAVYDDADAAAIGFAACRGSSFAWHRRDGEAGAAIAAAFRDHAAVHRPDLFLEHDVVAGTAP